MGVKIIPTKLGYPQIGKKPRTVPAAEAAILVQFGMAKYEEVAPTTYTTRAMTAAVPAPVIPRRPRQRKVEPAPESASVIEPVVESAPYFSTAVTAYEPYKPE